MHPRVRIYLGFAETKFRHLVRQVGVRRRSASPFAALCCSALMAGVAPSTGPTGAFGEAMGLRAFTPALRQVQWSPKFRSELSPRYDGAADPAGFLQAYEEAVLAADGDDKVMANWLPMALVGAPCTSLLNVPESSVAS